MKVTLNRLIELILQLDDELDLKGNDRLIYHQSRFWLFRHLQKNADSTVKHKNESIRGSFLDIAYFLFSFVRILLNRTKALKPVLVIEHLRDRGYSWDLNDPYLGSTENELMKKGNVVVVVGLSRGNSLSMLLGSKTSILVIPRSIINLLRFVFSRFAFNRNKDIVDQVDAKFEEWGLKSIFSSRIYMKRLQQIRADNWLCNKIVKIIQPKALICIDGYNSNSSFILNCNLMGVPTVEYQHGIISEGHIGYTYGSNYSIPNNILPKHYILWGEFWKRSIAEKVKQSSDIRVGTYEYGKWCRRNSKKEDNPNGVLFIMQPSVASIMAEQIKIFLSKYPNEKVGIKYHPKQSEKLEIAQDVHHHFYENIYDLFIVYKYIVGCYSTALFEAIAMGRSVFYMPVLGFNFYEGIMESAGIRKLNTFDEMFLDRDIALDGANMISDASNVQILSDVI